jgi:hypothetical protein
MPSFLVIFMCVFYVCFALLASFGAKQWIQIRARQKNASCEATNKQTSTCGGQSISGTIAVRILRMNRACGGAVMWKKI